MSNISTKQLAIGNDPHECGIILLAAGFEDRAFYFLQQSKFKEDAWCLLIEFANNNGKNAMIFAKFLKEARKKFGKERILTIKLSENNVQQFERDLNENLSKLPRTITNVWVDISGMPTYAICISLNSIRTFYPIHSQCVIYSAAENYFPTLKEYDKLTAKSENNEEFVPKAMAMEMAEVLILETFSGHRSKEGISCLAVFPGYDAHRAAGVIESINPSMLLLLYGDPGGPDLKWRLELSKQLNRKFESTRKAAVEVVSTLNPNESLECLESYYEYLFEDYDFTISPICSKMQVVGTFLFWEMYREVQLVFPLPIGYDFDKRPMGTSQTYITHLEPRNSLYRNLNPPSC